MTSLRKSLIVGFCLAALSASQAQADTVQWIDHFALRSGNTSELLLTTNSTTSGVGGGLTGVVLKTTRVGDTFADGGNKVAHMALGVGNSPSGINIRGVRVCYESTSTATYLTQVRITQVSDPPTTAVVKFDDLTDRAGVGGVCVNTTSANIAVGNGPLILSLRFYFGSTADAVVIRGLGIILG